MMPTARVLATTALLCLIPLQNAVATAYKWVDDLGQTHYSQTPPNATKVEIIKTQSSSAPAPAAATPQTSKPADSGATASPPAAAKAEDAAIREKNCSVARKNQDALTNADVVNVKDANGLLHTLTPEERKARIEEAEKIIKEFCKD